MAKEACALRINWLQTLLSYSQYLLEVHPAIRGRDQPTPEILKQLLHGFADHRFVLPNSGLQRAKPTRAIWCDIMLVFHTLVGHQWWTLLKPTRGGVDICTSTIMRSVVSWSTIWLNCFFKYNLTDSSVKDRYLSSWIAWRTHGSWKCIIRKIDWFVKTPSWSYWICERGKEWHSFSSQPRRHIPTHGDEA